MEGINWIDLGTVVGVLVGAFGLKHIVTDQYNRFVARRDSKRLNTNTWHNYFNDMDGLYAGLRKIIHDTGADRVVIVQNKNGGGKPHLDSIIYSTIIFEEYTQGSLGSIKDKWHLQELDREYLAILSRMDKDGHLEISTKDLSKDGILGPMYFSQGIVGSKLYKISDKHDRYIYLVANYAVKVGGVEEADVYRVVVNDLRVLFDRD